MAITDASYFDWTVLPEAPSSLEAKVSGSAVNLVWEVHGGNPSGIVVERRTGDGAWTRIAKLPSTNSRYDDASAPTDSVVSYRVRAVNGAGESAYSNLVHVKR